MENDNDADYYYDEVYDDGYEESSWEPVVPEKPPKAVYTPFEEESGTEDDLSYYDEDEKEVLTEEAEEDLWISRYPYQKWGNDPRFTVCPTVKELFQWMPIAQKYHEGHFTKQQYKDMILEDIKKKTMKKEEKDMDVVDSLVLQDHPDHPELSLSSPPAVAIIDDVAEEIKIPEEKKETNSWGSGRLQKTLDIKEITEPVVEVSIPTTMEQKETTSSRGQITSTNPRMSLLRPVHKNSNHNNNHRQRDSDRKDRKDHTNHPPESGPHPVKRVSMLRPKMDSTNMNTNMNTNTTHHPVLNASRNSNHLPNPRSSSHNSNSGGQMTSPRPSQTHPNNNNNDRRNHRNNNKMRPQSTVTGSPTSSASPTPSVPLSTTATTSPRKDLLCRFLASKHGPNDWEKCTRSHSMDEWVPKECRHDKRCSRPGCGFFHKSKDTKQTYLLKLMSVENSFYHNHSEDFKKLYLK